MAGLRMTVFHCLKDDCNHAWEELTTSDVEREAGKPCQECGGETEQPFLGAGQNFSTYLKTIVKGNSDFVERQQARLTVRANDHWKKEGHSEAIERQRSQWKREGFIS